MPWREKSQSARWRSARCARAAAIGPFTRSHSEPRGGWGTAKTHCQTCLTVCLPCSPICLSVCLTAPLSLPQPVGGTFPTKRQRSVNLPTHVATSSSIPDSICTDLRRAALIIESRGGERWGGGVCVCEPKHCLCMNQGHWKIKADRGEIITDCSCGIILMRLCFTKPCLLYRMASLWDNYC